MYKFLALSLAALISFGCSGTGTPSSINSAATNTNTAIVKTGDSAIVSSHSNDAQKSASPSTTTAANATTATNKSSASTESPMARPIDVADLSADIEKAEREFKKNPGAKADLAKAYFVRATALTDAAQYRAALGDYRRGLKLDPNDQDAKKMHDEILRIFQSINREPPKEGEEPKPLPMN